MNKSDRNLDREQIGSIFQASQRKHRTPGSAEQRSTQPRKRTGGSSAGPAPTVVPGTAREHARRGEHSLTPTHSLTLLRRHRRLPRQVDDSVSDWDGGTHTESAPATVTPPVRTCPHGIMSPLCLPVRPSGAFVANLAQTIRVWIVASDIE